MVVYYDLENYWVEQNGYHNCLQQLEDNCAADTYPGIITSKEKIACKQIHSQLKTMVAEIDKKNALLYHGNQGIIPIRQKRAPLSIIGNIQHALFGVLDEDFARDYETNIKLLNENENHLYKLLQNQTSIAEATANIIQKNRDEIQEQFSNFENQVRNFEQSSNKEHDFLSAALSIFLHINSYQKIQDALIDLVIDTQHGKISPLLLSPDQLLNQLAIIQGNLDPYVSIPGYKSSNDLVKIYKLMSTKTRVLNSKIMIEIKIPLINSEQFQIFNLVPIPTNHNDNLVSIIPSATYLAIT